MGIMKKTSFIYLNCKHYDGTVFVTQIADWLRLYRTKGIEFQYYHQFYGSEMLRWKWCKSHLKKIRTVIPYIANVSYSFPEKWFFPQFNAFMLNWVLNKKLKESDRVVIFSRMLYGKEISLLKKISKKEIIYIYDARGASMEEHKYQLMKKGLTFSKIEGLLKHISEVEGSAVKNADLVFTVSEHLRDYLCEMYSTPKRKFFVYPCLSDSTKFFYDEKIREETRSKLGYNKDNHVYIYSGGLENNYHLLDQTLSFLNNVASWDDNARFLFLSKDRLDDNKVKKLYVNLYGKVQVRSVSNEDVYKYLNASDFGILFRDDVIMNNVASPSKFAEYVLCGLPTIISKGVGDFSELCEQEKLGIVVENFNLSVFDKNKLLNNVFDRNLIADFGKKTLSKQSQLNIIISQFKQFL